MADIAAIREALERRIELGKALPPDEEAVQRFINARLHVYWGIDPTGPDIHLGHVVSLLFLKNLAELGHRITIVFGDFTAQIGDPTGKLSDRQALSEEEVRRNYSTYLAQITRVIPERHFKVRHNSTWLKKLRLTEFARLAHFVTVQQLEKRDMFVRRREKEKEILLSEFIYPLLQGFDSVVLGVDAEVGGQDQLFNMSIGRDLAKIGSMLGKKFRSKDKMVLPNKLLAPAGHKMSKTEGNMIRVVDSPQEIRRKVLALDDSFIRDVFVLCTEMSVAEIDKIIGDARLQNLPQEAKERLASTLVTMFHGNGAAAESREEVELVLNGVNVLSQFLAKSGAVESVSRASALIRQRAVRVNDEVVENLFMEINKGDHIRVGKGKFYRVV